MKIYTKTGDAGKTGLLGGERVSKTHARIAAYGDLDELNASIGVVLSHRPEPLLVESLTHIQNKLFMVGSELAATNPGKFNLALLDSGESEKLENWIDRMETELEPLRNFILPSGNPAAAALHMSRTICRRAERNVVALAEKEPVRSEIIVYLNRLSDFLFIASRYENKKTGFPETLWTS